MELQTIVVGGASASMTWFDSAGRMTQKSMLRGNLEPIVQGGCKLQQHHKYCICLGSKQNGVL